MTLKKILYSILCGFFLVDIIVANDLSTNDRVGWWNFNDTTNVVSSLSGYGIPLELVGTQQVAAGPVEGDFAAKIGAGSYYKLRHQILPNGGGNLVNEYSVQIDFKIESLDVWHCMYQTTVANNNDGDCFINTNGYIGVAATGYSTYAVKADEWYRLIVSVKNGTQYKYYLDGQLLTNGTVQAVDGRFALDSLLLMFADENGEDNSIIVSEIGIWDRALSGQEISNLDGFGHKIPTAPGTQLILVPYLQEPFPNSVYVCWHDTLATTTSVEYGTTESLGQVTTGTSEIIADDYRWNSVKLTDLLPNTEYFYKAISGSGESKIYNFKTLPDSSFKGKLRFLLLSDTHNSDTTMPVKVLTAAKKKIQELYGPNLQDDINVVLHSGDLVMSGSIISQYTDQYFAVMSDISPYVPFMTVTGNHEAENQSYYKYMHYDDVAPFVTYAERFWSFKVANTLIMGLNSNAVTSVGILQTLWLNQILPQAQADSTIDFIFVMSHHFSVTELWGEGITFDGGPKYITNQVYPLFKKYSKVVQHSYGHTHGYERGTIESEDADSYGDFRIICGGGGGGSMDRWGLYVNNDYPSIQITLDDYCFQIIEVDVENKIYESTMYSLGNADKPRDIEVRDHWYRKFNQPAPQTPVTYHPIVDSNKVTFNTSEISGDSLMTVKIQVAEDENFINAVIDTMIDWKDIYGVDENFDPVDLNKDIDLTKLSFESSNFISGSLYYYRVKYRDHNLKWSGWSNVTSFNNVTDVDDNNILLEYALKQNYPNPFNPVTNINFSVAAAGQYVLKVYNVLGQEIKTLMQDFLQPGSYNISFDGSDLASGVYLYQLSGSNKIFTKKMILMK